jgi:hypothetical protein
MSVTLTFLGAAREVTGSLEFAGTLKEKLGWLAQVPSAGQPLTLG